MGLSAFIRLISEIRVLFPLLPVPSIVNGLGLDRMGRVGQHLVMMEPGIVTIAFQQLSMAAILNDLAPFHDDNAVGIAYGT